MIDGTPAPIHDLIRLHKPGVLTVDENTSICRRYTRANEFNQSNEASLSPKRISLPPHCQQKHFSRDKKKAPANGMAGAPVIIEVIRLIRAP